MIVNKLLGISEGQVIETYEKGGKPYIITYEACPRCGGTGNYSYNQIDGTRCFKCTGSMLVRVDKRILSDKEKATRERAKQRKIEKAEAEAESKRIYQEEHKEEIEAQRMADDIARAKKICSFGEADTVYAVMGDSFSIKEQLKEEGARWSSPLRKWCFDVDMEKYTTLAVNFFDIVTIDGDGCRVDWDKIEVALNHNVADNSALNEYIGAVGDKIEAEVKVINIIAYEMQMNYHTQYMEIVVMQDKEGHRLTWSTGANKFDIGASVKIKCAIKDHREYKGAFQTVVIRVKEVKAK